MKHAKFRISQLLSLVLTLVWMLIFVGCGSGLTPSEGVADGQTVATTTATTAAQASDSTTTATTAATTAATTEAASTTAVTTTTEATTATITTVICTGPPTDRYGVPDKLSGQKITMFIWWNATEEDQRRVAYYEQRTGIEVSFETSSLEEYQSTLSARMMANNAPALAAIRSEWYPLPITRGLMQPIANTGWDFTNQNDDIYALDLMDQFAYKGVCYGVALKGSLASDYAVMYFNKDILKAKGVKEDPYELWRQGRWNWDTCLSIAKQCTDAKQNQYGVATLADYYWMLSADQDLILSEADGLKNNAQSEQVLDAWVHAVDMVYTHLVTVLDFANREERFYSGRTAMLGASSSLMKTAADGVDRVTFDWGIVPFPSPKGQSAVAACEGVVWGFPAKVTGDKLQAAMWWLRYYLDDFAYGSEDVYPTNECWEVLYWMSTGQMRSLNSVSVLCYGGECDPQKVDRSILNSALIDTSGINYRAILRTTLGSVSSTLEKNMAKIENEV